MYAKLVQLKVANALKGYAGMPDTMSEDQKEEVLELTYRTIILHIGVKVTRQVNMIETAAKVWLKLESLYMTTTLINRVHLKSKWMNFRILDDNPLDEYLDDLLNL